jgi:hypothetical protein
MGRNRRSLRLAALATGSLFLLVLVANLLWSGPPTGLPAQPRMPPTASPFPVLNATGSVLHVVRMDSTANLSTRLLLTSLQGIVNREHVQLFLDVGGVSGNTTQILAFLKARYGVNSDVMSIQTAIDTYAPRTKGLVVFDPARPESVNIATMMASRLNATIVGPDLVDPMRARYGLQPLFDYGRSDWASLDAIAAYDRALRELYPGSASTLLSILPPDRWAIRDYLIATNTFVFYLPQGALASPFEAAATARILHAAPRGIPVLGWFNSLTLTEENSFVQLVSGEGKFVVGVQDLPNLSVLTAFGRSGTRHQAPPPPAPPLEDKTYVVLAVPDGDNLDFVAGRMAQLWAEPVRGTMPFTWSLNPLLVDLAPPLLDSFYDTASPLDRFIAAPSGAGYLYPDYASAEDLSSFVAFSKRYLNASDMDVVWLLNAFSASEIPYSSASLSTYVGGLSPDGIVLDYDDQPRTQDAWVQAGDQAFAPVVRSTHFWTTRDNALGKLDAAMASWDGGPHFLWLTIYTFRFDLQDAKDLVDLLSARLGGNLQVVGPSQFFGLLREQFVQTAKDRLAAVEANPLESWLFGPTVASARARVVLADSIVTRNPDQAANEAFRALEELRGIAETEALLLSVGVLLMGGFLAFIADRSRGIRTNRAKFQPVPFVFVAMLVASLVFSLREAVEQNFWTYPTILLGIAVAGLYRPLRRAMDAAYPDRAPVAAALASIVLTSLAIRTTAAFPLALIGGLLALDMFLSRRPAGSPELLVGLGVGTAIGFLGAFDLPTFSVIAVLLVGSSFGAKGLPILEERREGPRPLGPGFLIALSLSGLAVAFYYSLALRLQLVGDSLSVVAAALLVAGPTLAILIRRILPPISSRTAQRGGLAAAVAWSGVVLVLQGTLLTMLALIAIFASLSFAAMASLERYTERGGEPRRPVILGIMLLPLLLLFFRMPPIVYSLTIVALPEPIEYALYAPTVMIAVTCVVLLAIEAFRGPRRGAVGKDYPREGDGGAIPP